MICPRARDSSCFSVVEGVGQGERVVEVEVQEAWSA